MKLRIFLDASKIYLDQKLSLSLCPGNNWGVLPLGPSSLHKQELVISVQ